MRLYDSAISGNCYKVRLMLAHLGIPCERVPVDVGSRRDRLRTLGDKNPILRIPILELDDGRCLAESNAILWHLAEGTDYLPADSMERNRVLQWLFFEQNNHEPNIAVARYWIQVLGKEKEYADHLVLKREGGHGALSVMERCLKEHPFFVADRYSIDLIGLERRPIARAPLLQWPHQRLFEIVMDLDDLITKSCGPLPLVFGRNRTKLEPERLSAVS